MLHSTLRVRFLPLYIVGSPRPCALSKLYMNLCNNGTLIGIFAPKCGTGENTVAYSDYGEFLPVFIWLNLSGSSYACLFMARGSQDRLIESLEQKVVYKNKNK
jgi:hypothetical protein